MSTLTTEMKDMIARQQCFVATVDSHGQPNVAPKRSTRVHDDETLLFTEGTGGRTYQNMLAGSPVTVAVVDREALDGFRFLCTVELLTDGDPLFEQARAQSAEAGRPAPKAVARLAVHEIHSLKPGPMAGKKIG